MMELARRLGFGAVLAALCCQPVAAQNSLSDKLAVKQTWTMSAPRGQPQPDCVETWTFAADGQMTVKSGAETVVKTWRVSEVDGPVSLYTRRLSSTGGADCLGAPNDPSDVPAPEEGGALWVLAFNSGDALILCNPQYVVDKKTKKKTPMYGDDACWGELQPAQ
jgi:hypothetical protein